MFCPPLVYFPSDCLQRFLVLQRFCRFDYFVGLGFGHLLKGLHVLSVNCLICLYGKIIQETSLVSPGTALGFSRCFLVLWLQSLLVIIIRTVVNPHSFWSRDSLAAVLFLGCDFLGKILFYSRNIL